MPVKKYISLGGTIIGEREVGGARRNYGVDALGSVTSTIKDGAIENTYAYKPYGELLQKTGPGPDPKFRWVGTQGYNGAGREWADIYVRARTYSPVTARWGSRDPVWEAKGFLLAPPYSYANQPTTLTDRSALLQRHPVVPQIPPDKGEGRIDPWRLEEMSTSRDLDGATGCDIATGTTWRWARSVGVDPIRDAYFKCIYEEHEHYHKLQYKACCTAAGHEYNNAASGGTFSALWNAMRFIFVRKSFYKWVDNNAPWDEEEAYSNSVRCFGEKLLHCAKEETSYPGYCLAMEDAWRGHVDQLLAARREISERQRDRRTKQDCPFPSRKKTPEV